MFPRDYYCPRCGQKLKELDKSWPIKKIANMKEKTIETLKKMLEDEKRWHTFYDDYEEPVSFKNYSKIVALQNAIEFLSLSKNEEDDLK